MQKKRYLGTKHQGPLQGEGKGVLWCEAGEEAA